MRKVCYSVAMSLDGYIAGPNHEIDWITMDPELEFTQLLARFDTILLGRRTFEFMRSAGQAGFPGMATLVFSRTLNQRDHPNVTIIGEGWHKAVAALREAPGKDIWLMGGGSLFRSLAAAKLVGRVEVTLVPLLLGGGTPLLPSPSPRIGLQLMAQKVYSSGLVTLEYAVKG